MLVIASWLDRGGQLLRLVAMIAAEWQGLAAFTRRLTTMKQRVRPEVASLLRSVSDVSARAASKAAKGHRKTGRLQSSIKAHTTETTAGFSAVFYVKANRALCEA